MDKVIHLVKILICFFCWLTISPLFYYLAGKWRMKKGRLCLMLASPLFIIGYLIILLWGYATYLDYERKYYFANEDRIERITGVRLPNMDIVEYNKGKSSFTGDYSDRLLLEFEEIPSEGVYQTLDSLIETGKTGWRMNDSVYMYLVLHGETVYLLQKVKAKMKTGHLAFLSRREVKEQRLIVVCGKISYDSL